MFNHSEVFFCLFYIIFFKGMDDRGIIGCSETEYFSYNPPNSNDRQSIGSFKSIFKLDDPNTPTCFTNISPVCRFSC
jgi:hypothetical protein